MAVMHDMTNLVIQITDQHALQLWSKSHHISANRTMITDPSHQSIQYLNLCGKWEDHSVATS
jgi:hypothetical protein